MKPVGCRLTSSIAALFAVGLCGPLLLPPRAAAIGPDNDATATAPMPPPADTPSVVNVTARLNVPGAVAVAGERTHMELLRRFYAAHDYAAVWDTRRAQAEILLNVVLRAADHGLNPDAFHAGLLSRRTAILSPIERDLLLSDAFLGYADALARSRLKTGSTTRI